MKLKICFSIVILMSTLSLLAQNMALELNRLSPYNDYVLVGNGTFNELFDGKAGYSLEAWIKPRQLSTGTGKNRIFTSMITGVGAAMDVYFTGSGRLHIGGRSISTDLYQTATSSSSVVSAGEWYHIAAVMSFAEGSKSIKGYVNGNLVCSNNSPAFSSHVYSPGVGGIDVIGAHPNTAPQPFDQYIGVIDEYKVWDYPRSQAEIRADMDLELELPRDGLIAYWMFNEGEGTIAFDSSVSGIDASLVNFPADCWVQGNMPPPGVFISEPMYELGTEETFYIDVRIEGMKEDLRAYEISLSFDPQFIGIESLEEITEGSFLSAAGTTSWYAVGSEGLYTITGAILGGISSAATGSGSLFKIRMKSLAYGTGDTPTLIELSDPILRGIMNQDITLESLRGSEVHIDGPVLRSQVIPLQTGWNLISSWIEPQDPSMEAVFAELISDGFLVKVQDEGGEAFEYDPLSGWLNNMNAFSSTEGYSVQVDADCCLVVTGTQVSLPLSITLDTGWNYISYPHQTLLSALDVLQNLIDQGYLLKVQDTSGNAIEYDSVIGIWIDNIGTFASGEGYTVMVSTDTELIYTEVREADGISTIDKRVLELDAGYPEQELLKRR